MRTAQQMGITTIAVYSEVDSTAQHVKLADESIYIGGSKAADSYLNMPAILAACQQTQADAVHPGYGFLSESAAFSEAVQAAGMVFVGPDAHSIKALGNKSAGKAVALQAGVPCLPGYSGQDQSIDTLLTQAKTIGAPLMIKAASGGGGRGMRRVDDVNDTAALTALLESAANEARSAFGDPSLLLERLVEHARHIEVQVFGDRLGEVVYLGERDCSTQRRNQKIIEEAPAPGLNATTRAAMGEAAVKLAKAVAYVGAGTIEFLLSPDQQFYFLEMNTRLQVEHPVTEMITGQDLVQWQLQVAQGEPLPLTQNGIQQNGHAIELRICAEDPWQDYTPQSGELVYWHSNSPARFDHGLTERAQVSPFYDSMIGKLIVHADSRAQAIQKALHSLDQLCLLGLVTNKDFLAQCLKAPAFVEGFHHDSVTPLSTQWLGLARQHWQPSSPTEQWVLLAALAQFVSRADRQFGDLQFFSASLAPETPWPIRLADGSVHQVGITALERGRFLVKCHEAQAHCALVGRDAHTMHLQVDGVNLKLRYAQAGPLFWVDALGVCAAVDLLRDVAPSATKGGSQTHITSSMHGLVTKVPAAVGQQVKAGDLLVAIEAMKMEHRLEAMMDATVVAVMASAGQQITPGQLLIELSPHKA
jgi:geranyl-CoA carboxylase alpha subunit